MTAVLEGGECSAARPGRTLPPGKTRYPFYRRLGGSQRQSGRAENLVPTGIRSRTVQPVVSRYIDWATGPTYFIYTEINLFIQHVTTFRLFVDVKATANWRHLSTPLLVRYILRKLQPPSWKSDLTAQEENLNKKNRHYVIWNKNIPFFLWKGMQGCRIEMLKFSKPVCLFWNHLSNFYRTALLIHHDWTNSADC